jgi:rod shape-determining protein MreC
VSSPVKLYQDLQLATVGYGELLRENQKLRSEISLLQTRQLKTESLEHENTRLRGLLESSFKVGEQIQIAELLAINMVPYEQTVVVNKGSNFGVYQGQAVFDSNGVVGQVTRVTPYSAEVTMITDPSHAIPVQVNRNGLRTIAMGTGQNDHLVLPFLPSNADLRVGDLLVTSGLGGGFPGGYPVAEVQTVPTDRNSSGKITARPLAQLDRNRELMLVFSRSRPIPRIPLASSAVEVTKNGNATQ